MLQVQIYFVILFIYYFFFQKIRLAFEMKALFSGENIFPLSALLTKIDTSANSLDLNERACYLPSFQDITGTLFAILFLSFD